MKKISALKNPPKTLEEAVEVIAFLLKKIEFLEEQLNRNSKNSSQPPSGDYKKSMPIAKGHPGVTRSLVPASELDAVVD